MASNTFVYDFRVPFHDIDAAGVLFYGHLFRHAHDAYEAFMSAIGLPLDRILRDGQWLLPLARAECNYRLPIHHGEVIQVRLCVAELGSKHYVLGYRFVDDNGQVRADARTVHVSIKAEGRSSTPIPQPLAAALTGWQCNQGSR